MAITRQHSISAITDRLGFRINRVVSALYRNAAAGIRRIQFGQMQAVLHRLNDAQLDQIGIRRSEIPEYARRLISGDD